VGWHHHVPLVSVVHCFLQRRFVAGLTATGLKG
jgi:hypothetical protein